jgi:glyoxylase-like metal-dependent hydrolase (beta-lactamase superfamily II)
MRLWSILGNSQRLDGGAMFGNVPRGMWSQWIAPDEQNRIPLACRALLVDDLDGKTVLFETGIGAFFEPKLRERYGVVESRHVLLDSLKSAGFAHEDIDAVVLSHLHFDHAGGALAAWQPNRPAELLFPNAKFVVGRRCWERALCPHPRDRASFIPELQPLLENSGRMELVENAHSFTLGKHVRFSFSDGHTPGLMLAEIAPGRSPSATGRSPSASEAMDGREGPSEAMDGRERPPARSPSATGRSPSAPEAMDGREGPAEAMDGRERPPGRSPSATGRSPSAPEAMDGREGPAAAMDGRERTGGVVFCADLIPGRPWVHLPVTMGYDRAPELLIDEKRIFLEDKLARGVRLFFTHDTGCALAQVTRDDKGRFGTTGGVAELAGVAA